MAAHPSNPRRPHSCCPAPPPPPQLPSLQVPASAKDISPTVLISKYLHNSATLSLPSLKLLFLPNPSDPNPPLFQNPASNLGLTPSPPLCAGLLCPWRPVLPRSLGPGSLGEGLMSPSGLLPLYLSSGPNTRLWTSVPRCQRTDSCWGSNQTAGSVHLQGAPGPTST